MKRQMMFALSLLFIAASLAAAPAQKPGSSALALPVTGSFVDAAGTGTFAGTFYLTRFAAENDALVAKGILSGTLTSAAGTSLGTVFKSVTLPVNAGTGAATRDRVAATTVRPMAVCDILFLQLGPLDLDLLGVVLHLDQITLDLDAESGGGNLLGNLLCAVVSLLDGPAALLDIVDALNRLLDLVTGLLG